MAVTGRWLPAAAVGGRCAGAGAVDAGALSCGVTGSGAESGRGRGGGAELIAGNGPPCACSAVAGLPTRGCARADGDGGTDAGSDSFGSRRDSVNIALAERGLPTFGFRIARS